MTQRTSVDRGRPHHRIQGSRGRWRRVVRLGAVTTLLATAASAQLQFLTEEQAVSQAIRQNPRLSAAARQVGAAELGARAAGLRAGAEFLFTPGITSLSGTGEELLLRQPLELNGTRSARQGIARAQVDVTRAEAIVELHRLVFETRSAYLELYRAREQQAVAEEMLRAAEEFDRIARRQVELGVRPGVDRTQTGLHISQARQQLDLATGQSAAASAALNTAMGLAPDATVAALPPPDAAPSTLNREQLAAAALRNRAEIALEAAGRKAFQQEARLARAEGRPDLAPQVRSGSVVRGFRDTGIGIGVTLPIFDHGRRRLRIQQAEEGARAQDDRIAAARNQVRQEVEQAVARLSAASSVVRTYKQEVLEGARRLLESAKTGFRTGLTPVTAVLEAQRTYRTIFTGYTNAQVEQALARAELERATGGVSPDLLPRPGAGKGEPK